MLQLIRVKKFVVQNVRGLLYRRKLIYIKFY